jgi:hypothetical protein
MTDKHPETDKYPDDRLYHQLVAMVDGWVDKNHLLLAGELKTLDSISSMLTDTCGVIVQIIRLIPPERHDDRLSACAHILNEISDAVEHTALDGANTTKH